MGRCALKAREASWEALSVRGSEVTWAGTVEPAGATLASLLLQFLPVDVQVSPGVPGPIPEGTQSCAAWWPHPLCPGAGPLPGHGVVADPPVLLLPCGRRAPVRSRRTCVSALLGLGKWLLLQLQVS